VESSELPGWLKLIIGLCGGTFAWGLVAVLSKSWVESNVIEPIKELKESQRELRNNFIQFTERVTSQVFELVKNNKDISIHHSKLLEQVTIDARQAIHNSGAAVERADKIERMAKDLFNVSTALHDKNVKMQSQIKQISDDLIMVKGKIKSED
jgi:hypothetical protein